MGIIFVTGIDTGIGKSVVTGLMARWLAQRGCTVITQKLVQTGCPGPVAEDIAVHRRLMGTGLLDVDLDGTTCPCVYAYPASPHLAARIEDRVVDTAVIDRATDRLAARFAHVLIEGVGGALVPLTHSTTVLDYVAQRRYPLIVVGSLRLGSINHTLLTLRRSRQTRSGYSRRRSCGTGIHRQSSKSPTSVTNLSCRQWILHRSSTAGNSGECHSQSVPVQAAGS
jgi:dethiobiotin synthetase